MSFGPLGVGHGSGDMETVLYDPAGIEEQLVGLTATQTLTNKTLTDGVFNGTATGTAILDEDDLSSDSNLHLATQQSIKAYIDTENLNYLLLAGGTMSGDIDMGDNAIVDIAYLDFNLLNGVVQAEGRMSWNDDDGTLNVGLKGGNVNLQVGQEMVLRGKNVTGSSTVDGKPVRMSGASGSNPEFDFSDASVFANAGMIGLFTEDVNTNASGYVNIGGLVRGLDTSGTPYGETWNDADTLFVGDGSGDLTTTYPSGTSRVILAGQILRAHATEGVIFVHVINTPFLAELSGVTVSGVADNDLLAYDSSSGIWINQTPTEAGLDDIYVNVSGDIMTGQLSIEGTVDEIQLAVKAHTSQIEPLLVFYDKDDNIDISFSRSEAVFNENSTNTNFRIESANHEYAVFVDGSPDAIGIFTGTPRGSLDVSSGKVSSIVYGAQFQTFLRTNASTKLGFIASPGYLNAEELTLSIHASLASVNTQLFIGGGHASFNAFTHINFYNALTSTTTTGTLRMQITKAGEVVVNSVGDAAGDFIAGGDTIAELFKVDAGLQRLGINESAPLGLLHITGKANEIQLFIQGNDTQTDDIIRIADSSGSNIWTRVSGIGTLFLSGTRVEITGTVSALRVDTVYSPASTPSAYFPQALNFVPAYDSTEDAPGASFLGAFFNPQVTNTGTINLRALSAKGTVSAAAAITSFMGLRVDNPTVSGGGSIAQNYGIRIFDLTSASVNYAIQTNAGLVVFNDGGDANSDIRMESDTEDKLFLLDTGNNELRLGDGDTNYFVVDQTALTWWVGDTAGIPSGHCYGNEIAWSQASAVQNEWYDISDASMISGELLNVTHDGNGQFTIGTAGRYNIDWSGSFEVSVVNKHVQVTVSVNGTEDLSALNHFEGLIANKQIPCAGFTTLDLAESDTVNVSIRTTDAGTPNLAIDHLMLRVTMVRGT